MFRWDSRHLVVGPVLAVLLLLCLCWTDALSQQEPSSLYALKDDRNAWPLQSHLEAMPYQVPPVYLAKRSTIILDKLMYALQKALHKDPNLENETDLRQRTGPNGKVYWRCYFNAVSCFRRRRR